MHIARLAEGCRYIGRTDAAAVEALAKKHLAMWAQWVVGPFCGKHAVAAGSSGLWLLDVTSPRLPSYNWSGS